MILWNALEKDVGITLQVIEGTQIARRMIPYEGSKQPSFCWRPREFTLIVVHGEKKLAETVQRSIDPRPMKYALPWSLDAWRAYDASAPTWALRKASDRERDLVGFSAFILMINPIRDPETMTLTWYGDGKAEYGSLQENETASPFPIPPVFATVPSELVRSGTKPSRITLKRALDTKELPFPQVFILIDEALGSTSPI